VAAVSFQKLPNFTHVGLRIPDLAAFSPAIITELAEPVQGPMAAPVESVNVPRMPP